jgi:enamine deaminase RidA (YjgF/YER057c/UK114 family)
MVYGGISVLLVSGTAAISGQETIGQGDIRKQLEVTIENIRALSGRENITRYNGSSDQLKYQWIRVYIKHMDDFEMVRSICQEHFGDIPAIYLQADICRDDLLVEIEAQLRS